MTEYRLTKGSGNTVQPSLPKPGKFPLGSMQSRAAARALAGLKASSLRHIQFISGVPRPSRDNEKIHVGPRSKPHDGVTTQMIYLPRGEKWPPIDPSRIHPDCKERAEAELRKLGKK